MKTRIISGVIGLALLLGIILSGGIIIDISLLILTSIAIYEMKVALSSIDIKVNLNLNIAISVVMMICIRYQNFDLCYKLIPMIVMVNVILFVFKQNESLYELFANIFIVVYVVLFLYHIAFLKNTVYVGFILITAWGSDTCAYFAGSFFGKNKLCPHLSPKKTIEGAIGGIIGSTVLALVYALIFGINQIVFVILVGIIGSIAGQLGDLVASKIKRICGIKDYGNIMPGHGGVLDRFDSILLTAPVTYFLYSLFISL